MTMTLAERLIAYRKTHDLTQDDVAGMLETTQQTIANWESGSIPRPKAMPGVLALLDDASPERPRVPATDSPRSPIQVAFLSKASELVDAGKLDDLACVELLASWKQHF